MLSANGPTCILELASTFYGKNRGAEFHNRGWRCGQLFISAADLHTQSERIAVIFRLNCPLVWHKDGRTSARVVIKNRKRPLKMMGQTKRQNGLIVWSVP